MNKVPLIEVEPKELEFIFELRRQSTCSVRLTNTTKHYVAFKVKTTSPKKYSVQPNVGVLMPKSTSEFIVTMQAQKEAPADMVSKDKFLIQSTIVPAETTREDVNSSLFIKDGSRYIEENKMKVALISPPSSSEFSPIGGELKNGFDHEKVAKNVEHKVLNGVLKLEEDMELKMEQDKGLKTMNGVEEPKEAGLKMSKDEGLNTIKDEEELKPEKAKLEVYKDLDLNMVKNVKEQKESKNAEELKPEKNAKFEVSKDLESKTAKNVEELKRETEAESKVSRGIEELKLMEVIEQMKSKLDGLDSKLNESAVTISKLTEERRLSNQETKILQEKLAELINKGPRSVQVGFPLLYVCMVALVCVFLGYHSRC
ncbi:PREDICTED: vesicle-associated protein 2-2-like isoform X2 [Lupinus angustifolius]|uniref:vesicle-associated protein 2-2-like isoform X2 n=1 Tax=Lupinus angustifolius TaxID=3871 RepID=UPI00092EB831|nr:PREDICTED: vesicle-associated protein 2-2-like isoform X2 [Lupinus angustifolius]